MQETEGSNTPEPTTVPAGQDEIRQGFLRYLPRRIAAFEKRILRYRFDGWEPSGMVVLGGDLQRLAEASERYGMAETRRHLHMLAQTVQGYVKAMHAPDPHETTRLFALLSAVIKSLPADAEHAHAEVRDVVHEPQPVFAADAVEDATAMPEPVVVDSNATGSAFESELLEALERAGSIELDAPIESAVHPATTIDTTEPAEPVATTESSGSIIPEARVESIEVIEAVEAAEPVASAAAIDTSGLSEAPRPSAEPETDAAIASTAATGAADASVPGEAVARDEHVEHVEPYEPEDPETTSDGGVRRVYHLSDRNAFALELERHLESEGYAIEPVADLDELSEMMMCLVPQVLLVDASHRSGLAAVGELRRDVQKRSQPPRRIQMVALVEHDNLDTRRLAHRTGVDLLLSPPFDIASISERLQVLHAAAAAEPIRVLIVEDNRADALYAQTVLSRAGMQARVESDPLRVLDTLASLHPDLVLMDLHMPFANGVEVTMLIREHAVFARLPIVFLSGESDPDSQLEAINAGGDDFLFKPIRPRHLIDAVRDRMRKMHPARKPA